MAFITYLHYFALLLCIWGCSERFSVNLQSAEMISLPNKALLVQLGFNTQESSDHVFQTDGLDMCQGVAVDRLGNIYCAGYTTGNLGETNGGGDDAFVIKLNSEGQIQWIRQLGATTQGSSSSVVSTSGNDRCQSVAVDRESNIYCAGITNGSLGETNGGSDDAFVMKLNSEGEILWIKQLGASTQGSSSLITSTSGQEACYGVAVDSEGNVYCSGMATGNLAETNGGGNDAFVMKLNSLGVILWIRHVGTSSQTSSSQVVNTSGDETCFSVAVDNEGQVYCAGGTSGNLAETSGGGGSDAFVMKLNSMGVILWIRQLGADTQETSTSVVSTIGDDACKSVAVDSEGQVYCGGYTHSSLGETNGGDSDAFILKLNSLGNVQWLKQLGSVTAASSSHLISSSGTEGCVGIAVDSENNVYCAGGSTGHFGETSGGLYDAYMLKLSPSGVIEWIRQLGSDSQSDYSLISSTSGTEICQSATVDRSGNPYCAGFTSAHFNETNGGSTDAFILKLKKDGTLSD